MEVTTQAPSGTKLRIDADRQFEGQQGDSVLRIQGESPQGGQVFDAAYVEVDDREAQVIGKVVRSMRSPQPELIDTIASEVQSTFSSKLSGRDAHQIAEMCLKAQALAVSHLLGAQDPQQSGEKIERLAERFERAAAKRRNAPSWQTQGNGQQQQQGTPGGQQHYGSQQGRS